MTNQTDDRTNPIIVQHAQSHHGAYILQDALHPRLASVEGGHSCVSTDVSWTHHCCQTWHDTDEAVHTLSPTNCGTDTNQLVHAQSLLGL